MTRSSYIPRLDGLRAVAVFAVLFEHFAPSRLVAFSPGGAGVTLFFVLSGYLITRIIINYDGFTLQSAAAHFYWRRLLRLSPPFYIALLTATLLNLPGVRENFYFHVLYLTNFRIGLSGEWGSGADHFWSLCTEEQFYLLWFFLLWFFLIFQRRFGLVTIFLFCLTLTLAFRASVYFTDAPTLRTVLLPGNLVSLASGALLVELQRRDSRLWNALRSPQVFLATTVAFAALSASIPFVHFPSALFYPFVASLWSASAISVVIAVPATPALDWLELPPVRYLGKISYGIFVYHMFLPPILELIPGASWAAGGSWTAFAILVVLSVAIAHVSWRVIERPILQYKDRVGLIPVGRVPSRS